MVVGAEEQLNTSVRVNELDVGEMFTFKSGQGIQEVVFGRDPAGEYEGRPVNIGPGILPVKLVGVMRDTSRQQFGIERIGNASFILTNYSRKPLFVENGFGEKVPLNPGMQTTLARNTQEMQRVKISWGKYYEVSVQSVSTDSGDKNWSVGLLWSVVGLK